MKTRTAIFFLTIIMAVAWWMLLQHYGATKPDGVPGRVSEATLLNWYTFQNRDYFDDKLPHDTKVVWESLRSIKAMGDTSCNNEGTGCLIELDPFVNVAPATAQETLFHEQCHIATWGKEIDTHGLEFKKCMRMLYDKGALDGLI
jgi:SprT-like family